MIVYKYYSPEQYNFDALKNHYFCYSNGTFKFFYTSANANWGFLFVTAFFAISGAVLYYNYPKIISFKDLKIFYYKRFGIILIYF